MGNLYCNGLMSVARLFVLFCRSKCTRTTFPHELRMHASALTHGSPLHIRSAAALKNQIIDVNPVSLLSASLSNNIHIWPVIALLWYRLCTICQSFSLVIIVMMNNYLFYVTSRAFYNMVLRTYT